MHDDKALSWSQYPAKKHSLELVVSQELVPYPAAQKWMEQRVNGVIDGNLQECLWFLEHSAIYTAGTSASDKDLLIPDRFPIYNARRGGKYTYHGPGQRIVYAIINLKKLHSGQPDIRRFVYQLEQSVIDALSKYGIVAYTNPSRIGIWVRCGNSELKIAAVGLHVKKWVTSHGIAININPNLEHFKGIIPCGLQDLGVTSLHELGVDVSMGEFDTKLQQCMVDSLGVRFYV